MWQKRLGVSKCWCDPWGWDPIFKQRSTRRLNQAEHVDAAECWDLVEQRIFLELIMVLNYVDRHLRHLEWKSSYTEQRVSLKISSFVLPKPGLGRIKELAIPSALFASHYGRSANRCTALEKHASWCSKAVRFDPGPLSSVTVHIWGLCCNIWGSMPCY